MTSELLPSGPQALDGWQKIAPVARVWLSWMRWHCLRHIRIVLQQLFCKSKIASFDLFHLLLLLQPFGAKEVYSGTFLAA